MTRDLRQQQSRVLVVDDEEVMRMVARESLEQAGFEVVEAESGIDAIDSFAETRPDIVLLDVKMPYMDGFAACRELRSSPMGRHTPILMMTGRDDVESVKRSYQVGATDFVAKPVNWLILAHRIDYMLKANRAGEELRKSRGRLANAQRIARLGYWEWKIDDNRLICSGEMHRILGERPGSLTGTLEDLTSRVHSEDRAFVAGYFKDLLSFGEPQDIEYRLVSSDGSERYVEQQTEIADQDGGRALVVTATVRDVTERKSAEEKIKFLAYYDGLTGLPNRRSFLKRLSLSTVDHSETDRSGAVLFLGLDRFGRVNETFGHSAGDKLLRMVAKRLLRHLRSSGAVGRDGKARMGDFVARFGGDEYTILLSDLKTAQDAATAGKRVLEMFSRPFQLEDQEIFVGASLGIAVFPNDSNDAEALVGMADSAMHHAKERRGNVCRFYDESMNASALERMKLESGLNMALENGELELYYQPQVELVSGQVMGIEALLRWNHPEFGLLGPDKFLDIAEETNLIAPIGEWVLRTACRQAREWQMECFPPLRVAVNLSSRQLLQPDLMERVGAILEETGMPAELLDLELTEGALMQGYEEATECMWRLKSLGVRLSVDDFGTGYSSLSRLARFPLDSLKIDRSFLKGVPGETDMEGIVSAIVAMADSLGLEVIAEGVEQETQIDFLLSHGCTRCQGFLFCEPQPAEQIRTVLENGVVVEVPATTPVKMPAPVPERVPARAPAPPSDRVAESIDRAVASLVEGSRLLSAVS
ncbi:MAG: EAL domain-containing protein [bacterium]|nr:EAL domain-containing protein [bacterium]